MAVVDAESAVEKGLAEFADVKKAKPRRHTQRNFRALIHAEAKC